MGGGKQTLGLELLTERAGFFFRQAGPGGGCAEFGSLGDDANEECARGPQQKSAGREQGAIQKLGRIGHAGEVIQPRIQSPSTPKTSKVATTPAARRSCLVSWWSMAGDR